MMSNMSQGMVSKDKKAEPIRDEIDLIEAKEAFKRKHPALSDQQVEDAKQDSKDAKKKYTKDLQKVEANLLAFLKEKEHPVVDPDTDIVIFWIREVPYWTLVQGVPEELQDTSLPEEERKKIAAANPEYRSKVFDLMAEIISIPEKPAEWWKTEATPRVMAIFEKSISDLFKKIEEETAFF